MKDKKTNEWVLQKMCIDMKVRKGIALRKIRFFGQKWLEEMVWRRRYVQGKMGKRSRGTPAMRWTDDIKR